MLKNKNITCMLLINVLENKNIFLNLSTILEFWCSGRNFNILLKQSRFKSHKSALNYEFVFKKGTPKNKA